MLTYSEHEIIQSVSQYFQEILELPNPAFGNLPMCPFFAKARLQNKILYKVYAFSETDLTTGSALMTIIQEFVESIQYEILHMIHPDVAALSLATFQNFMEKLNDQIGLHGLIAFGGHPENLITIHGIPTRSEPFVNFTLQPKKEVLEARRSLAQTDYYKNWTAQDLKQIEFPEV